MHIHGHIPDVPAAAFGSVQTDTRALRAKRAAEVRRRLRAASLESTDDLSSEERMLIDQWIGDRQDNESGDRGDDLH